MKAKELINKVLITIPEGMVFGYEDLELPDSISWAVAKAVSRMVKEGELRKVGKGKFYKPKVSRLGEVPPMIEGITKDLLYKGGKPNGYITGIQAFSQMGLTTQISSSILIASNSYRRPFRRAGYAISYTKQMNEITEKNIPLLRILDAIKLIKEIPATTPEEALIRIGAILRSLTEDEVFELEKYAKLYSAVTRALTGAILKVFVGVDSKLKTTLNPFTKYNIGISEKVLPNKSAWNII